MVYSVWLVFVRKFCVLMLNYDKMWFIILLLVGLNRICYILVMIVVLVIVGKKIVVWIKCKCCVGFFNSMVKKKVIKVVIIMVIIIYNRVLKIVECSVLLFIVWEKLLNLIYLFGWLKLIL